MSLRREELRALRRLALPIVLANLGTMLMGTVDVLMIGRLDDAQSLAAAVIANAWIHGTVLFAMGLVFGIDPIVTQAHGARDHERAGLALQRGVVVAIAAGLLVSGMWTFSEDVLLLLGQSPETARAAGKYTLVQAWSAPLFLVFVAMRQFLQGRGILAPTLWVIAVANVLNLVLNWALIFGHLGLPAMGLTGAGIATGLTRMVMLLGLLGLFLAFRLQGPDWVRWGRRAISPKGLLEVLRFGLPTGLHLSLEVWAFGCATLMAGMLGDDSAAAHSIVLNMASLTFMVPLGISAAAVTRVGNLIGEGRRERAQLAAWVALGMGAAVMGAAALVLLVGRSWLPTLYVNDPSDPQVAGVMALCAVILPIGAAFQVFDGTQVVGSGILRGMGETRPAAIFNLVGYWVLGLPLAAWMAFKAELGLAGVWWGLAIGLAIVAACMLVYLRLRGPAWVASVAEPQRTS